MLPDRVSNPGLLTYESGALQIALRGPAICLFIETSKLSFFCSNKSSLISFFYPFYLSKSSPH